MNNVFDKFIVLTGGPGAGKTSLLNALAQQGCHTSEEAGRGIIQSQNLIEGPYRPWIDPAGFAEQMLGWEMRSWHIAEKAGCLTFFDRGVPDIIGYLNLTALAVPAHIVKAADHYRYNNKVFILPPWKDIYAQDEERKQTFEIAIDTYNAMVTAYRSFGYQLIEVPKLALSSRVQFILDQTADIV
ncbi:AAA family ATPase [Paenochrobactrum sp. BZR 588]|uniref:AAA family ATPase n=1 Tax=unclassified Paenochrobactrum TaxID=2639760 RepID=UPI0038551391